jgi:hypothetical protein
VFRNGPSSSTREVLIFLRSLHRNFSTSISTLSRRPRHYILCVPCHSTILSHIYTRDIQRLWSVVGYNCCQSQSYFTTGGLPPITSSLRQAPLGSRPEILFIYFFFATEPLRS